MDQNPNTSFSSHTTPSGPSLPLEWAVCPGATEDAYISMVPHGTIITANSFTSLFLLRAELSNWERVHYEVHLLTGGLMQIGWCVTASGLPFTTNEGVGDFPLSVAADGCRGMLWNLTGEEVPALRWKPGDILGCATDFGTGTFDFFLNGEPCCTATLPTKGTLLQQGARWYTDRYSTDEMLTYSPALSLAEGEACLVNLGEAPFRYPRPSYVSLQMHHCFGSLAPSSLGVATSESLSSGAALSAQAAGGSIYLGQTEGSSALLTPTTSAVGGGAASSGNPTRSSAMGSTWSASSVVRVGLGGSDLEDLFVALDIRFFPSEDDVGAMELLARCIVAPSRKVSEMVMTLISWFEADTQGRWRALCMVLYLWLLRFYWYDERHAEEAGVLCAPAGAPWHPPPHQPHHHRAPAIGAEPITRIAASLSMENRRRLSELFLCLKLFLPPEHFLVVPGLLTAILQHRMGNTPGAQEKASSIISDLITIDAFRRGWVRETGTFCSTLLNLCALHAPSAEELKILSELIAKHVPSTTASQTSRTSSGESAADSTAGAPSHSNRQVISLLLASKELCARQTKMWLAAEQCVEQLVADEECRGAVVTALLRFMADTQLRSPVYFADPLRTPSYNDGLPYTFSLYLQPTVMGVLTLSIVSALGKVLWPLDQSCPLSNVDPLGGLRWRDLALNLLPVHDFYLHGLTGYGLMPTDWPDVRVGGSFHHVRRFIRTEEEALRKEEEAKRAAANASMRGAPASATSRMGTETEAPPPPTAGRVLEREPWGVEAVDEDAHEAALPAAVTRRNRVTTGSAAAPTAGHWPDAPEGDDVMEGGTVGEEEGAERREERREERSTHREGEETDATAAADREPSPSPPPPQDGREKASDRGPALETQTPAVTEGGKEERVSRRPLQVSADEPEPPQGTPPPPPPPPLPETPLIGLEQVSTWMNDSRFWESRAEVAEASRGHFTELNVTDQHVDDAGHSTEVALAERGKEILLVAAIATSLFVRPVLGASLTFLESFSDGVAAYHEARHREQAQAEANAAAGEHPPASTSSRLHEGSGSTTTYSASTTTEVMANTPRSNSGEHEPDGDAGPSLSAQDRLRGVAISLVPLVTLMDASSLQGLGAFAAAMGKMVSYYWSRMALFERLYAFPDAAARPGTASEEDGGEDEGMQQLWRQEAEEAAVCPARAFLMLPLAVIESSMDLWLFSGVAHGRSVAMADRYPGILLAGFDAMRRRTVSPSQTRSYMYRAMASLLGFCPENRLQTARLMLEQERHCAALNAAERERQAAKGLALNTLPHVPVLRGSILDCLDVYMRDDNFNDSAALNFLFALSQEDGCLLPPPRMLDENFWWCLPSNTTKLVANATPASPLMGRGVPHAEAGPSADQAYFAMFCRATTDVDLLQYSTTVISKCNRLLTQFSQLRPVTCTATMATADIKAFHTKYTLLRKSLYVLDFILRAMDHNEGEARSLKRAAETNTRKEASAQSWDPGEETAGDRETTTAAATPAAAAADSAARDAAAADADEGIPVQAFLRFSQHEAAISAVMDVVTQSLVRIAFQTEPPQPQQPASSRSTRDGSRTQAARRASLMSRSTAEAPTPPASQRQSKVRPFMTSAVAVSSAGNPSPSSVSNRSVGPSAAAGAETPWSENVLLPARSLAINGHYVCASAPCTVTGLLAPVFSILHRALVKHKREAGETNQFLAVTSDVHVLLTRSLELLEHPAWWSNGSSPSNGGGLSADTANDEDELIPPSSQRLLRELQEELRALKAESVAARSRARRRNRPLVADGEKVGSSVPLMPPPHATAAVSTPTDASFHTSAHTTAINRRRLPVSDDFTDDDDAEGEAKETPSVSPMVSHVKRTRLRSETQASLEHPNDTRTPTGEGATTLSRSRRSDAPLPQSPLHTLQTAAALTTTDLEASVTSASDSSSSSNDDDDENGSTRCMICVERPADIQLRPCGHQCCHLCFSRSRATQAVVRLPSLALSPAIAAEAASAGGEAGLPSSTFPTTVAETEASSGADPPQNRTSAASSNVFTLSWASFAAAPPATEGPQCFFCKGRIERVVKMELPDEKTSDT